MKMKLFIPAMLWNQLESLNDSELERACINPEHLKIIRKIPALFKEQQVERRLVKTTISTQGIISYELIDFAWDKNTKNPIEKSEHYTIENLESIIAYQDLIQEKD